MASLNGKAWRVPDDPMFVAAVRATLREATDRARECAGLPPLRRQRGPYKRRRGPVGRCVECGVAHDDRTDGCTRCDARHFMRARAVSPAR